ncbi:glycosyltransferase family protein [Natronolimnohabitans innermongolicus]|uniref:DUF2064 domain-containing protein n=1 Tax=Natronolimnohabitans innermongolicus JCM 12255 TaxID=1227499 RepID=L9XJX4_9EURY|nr:hypothetical protein [Natronolimnohabitans innermongolicus]ELY61887.1 hypothetical protein C493_01365 [Natronolimnohabitans innermongolicus JCM 12255]
MIVVVPVDPPREGLVLPSLVDESSLSPAEAVSLYEAAVADVLRAVASSGGDLLINYRDGETVPDEYVDGGADPEAEIRSLAVDALGKITEVSAESDGEGGADGDGVRFERQVGSTRSARVGNTVTHLLEREDATSVGVLEPTAPLVRRTEIDGAAMSLRRNDVVLGPSTEGETYLAGFAAPVDFTDAYTTPRVATLADRAAEAELGTGFAPMMPSIETPAGFRATIAMLEARAAAETPGGEATAAVIDDLGLSVGPDGSLERA